MLSFNNFRNWRLIGFLFRLYSYGSFGAYFYSFLLPLFPVENMMLKYDFGCYNSLKSTLTVSIPKLDLQEIKYGVKIEQNHVKIFAVKRRRNCHRFL